MNKKAHAIGIAILAAVGTANAQTVYVPGDGITSTTNPIGFSPNDSSLADGLTHEDEDMHIGVAGDAAPGFGTGSFQANGATKTAIQFNPETLFGTGASFTMSDIANVSFWTKQNGVPSDPGTYLNWYLEIYTATTGSGDDSWYRRRLNFEPYFSPDLSDANQPSDSWVEWSTDTSANQLRVFDANRGDPSPVYGTYTDPYLSDIQVGPVDWSDDVWFMAISTGSGWAAGFDGQVDGVTVTLHSGQVATIDFEAVPAPASCALMALGGLAAIRRRRA